MKIFKFLSGFFREDDYFSKVNIKLRVDAISDRLEKEGQAYIKRRKRQKESFRKFRKVGECFNYLGIKMTVIHIKPEKDVPNYERNIYMEAQYIQMPHATIESKCFDIDDLPLLKKMNKDEDNKDK